MVPIPPFKQPEISEDFEPIGTDLREIKGQKHVKRAMEVAAAWGHNVLTL